MNPNNYEVAPLIFVEGLGWYSKPTCASQVVQIQPDGSWTAAVTPSGSDTTAIRFAAFLVPANSTISCTMHAPSLPAALDAISVAKIVVNRPDPQAPVINFSGYRWMPKSNSVQIYPGPCMYSASPANLFVDAAGALHLLSTNTGSGWNCVELYSQRVFGFGRFTFMVSSSAATLDPNLVAGFFTWSDDDSSFASREIDVEFSKFGDPSDANNAQFAVQPYGLPMHRSRFNVPAISSTTNNFEWRPGQVLFSSTNADGSVNSQWTATAGIPPQGDQNFRINLWTYNGVAPAAATEVVVSSFTFVPDYTDFDLDGKVDLAVWRPGSGTWWVLPSSTGDRNSPPSQWGLPGDVPLSGDFDGDGRNDFAVWRPNNGTWYIIPSSDPMSADIHQWGLPGDVPVPADFDGDGQTDLAVWRPSNGTWYVIPSSTMKPFTQQWGLPGDVPVPADFDGDGKADFAVWRPSSGTWFVIPSANPIAPVVQQWGLPNDIPIAGDFDGDGKSDFAVWRPVNGTWYVIPSGNPAAPYTQQWGLPGDVPVAKDYDNDNKTDFAVWRPSSGIWFIMPSSSPGGPIQTQWGLPGDIPIHRPLGT